MMDAKLKADWVAALRSREFKQGRAFFEWEGRFCCLGVLCKVAGVATTLAEENSVGNWRFVESVLPPDMDLHLAGLNDNGATFPEIADCIEANIPADEHSVS